MISRKELREFFIKQESNKLNRNHHRKTGKEPGYIYIIKLAENRYKIGRTKDLKVFNTRYSTYYINMEVIKIFEEINNVFMMEKYFHLVYRDKLIKNELFSLEQEDENIIKSCNTINELFNKTLDMFVEKG